MPRVLRKRACRPRLESLEGRAMMAGDVVLDWNQTLLNAVRADRTDPGPGWASRNMAIVHAAIFDAVDAIDRTYKPYVVDVKAPSYASPVAAAAEAAYTTLVGLYPLQKATFDAALQKSLASVPKGMAKSRGITLGRTVADEILALRAHDGSSQSSVFQPGTEPGQWRPTPPDYRPAWGPDWGKVTPFGMASARQFAPPPPPSLTSAAYAAAFNQVKALGARDSKVRTPEQTQIGNFWAYDRAAMGTPLIMYNEIAATVARSRHNTMVQDARLFAILNVSMADAGIAAWAAKYQYDLWRPITAIRAASQDGNPKTVADPNWTPLGVPGGKGPNFTPPFPAYISGHSAFGAAAFQVLTDFYGTDKVPFTVHSDEMPGVTRQYTRFSQAAAENGMSRIYLGVHWMFDNVEGQKTGREVGNYDFQHLLRPTVHHALAVRPVVDGRWARSRVESAAVDGPIAPVGETGHATAPPPLPCLPSHARGGDPRPPALGQGPTGAVGET